MPPEISRRCKSCGASVRSNARFCPQCGGGLGAPEVEAPVTGPEAGGALKPTREYGAVGESKPSQAGPDRRPVPPTAEHINAPHAPETEGRSARPAARIREAKESLMPHVERMREEALVVFDEAPDDSGLRFVLIAAGLFAVFVLFLFLSVSVLR